MPPNPFADALIALMPHPEKNFDTDFAPPSHPFQVVGLRLNMDREATAHYSTLLRLTSIDSNKGQPRKGAAFDDALKDPTHVDPSGTDDSSAVSRWLSLCKTRILAVGFLLCQDVAVSRMFIIVSTMVMFLQVRRRG